MADIELDDVLFAFADTCPEYSYTEAGVRVTDVAMHCWGCTAYLFLHSLTFESGKTSEELHKNLWNHLATLIGTERATESMAYVIPQSLSIVANHSEEATA
jgi:hypothetical protein